MSLPTADDLFRPTVVPDPVDGAAQAPDAAETSDATPARQATETPAQEDSPARGTGSGRVRHDEKMTVYITSDELLDIEHARLSLRRLGLGVDRGRLVRAAVAIALADFELNGDESVLVQRLSEQAAG